MASEQPAFTLFIDHLSLSQSLSLSLCLCLSQPLSVSLSPSLSTPPLSPSPLSLSRTIELTVETFSIKPAFNFKFAHFLSVGEKDQRMFDTDDLLRSKGAPPVSILHVQRCQYFMRGLSEWNSVSNSTRQRGGFNHLLKAVSEKRLPMGRQAIYIQPEAESTLSLSLFVDETSG